MFDQLHDPDPPAATSRHLAAVAERAAGMRRRRTAAASGLTVVALVAAGSLAVTIADRTDGEDVEVAGDALPQATLQPAPVDSAAPTTTVLDPSSLPPAVPVNPDPSELPPAVPVNPDPGDGDTGDGAESGGSTGGEVEQPSGDDTTSGEPGDSGTPSEEDTSTEEPIDLATTAALRSADPIVAVTTSDTAVWFPSHDAEPIEITGGGGVERVDFLADGTATIETRSAGDSIASLAPDGSAGTTHGIGTNHEVGPDGATVCGLDGDNAIVCGRFGESDETTVLPFDRPEVVGHDLTWLDGDTVLVIGEFDAAWSMSIVTISNGAATTEPFASRSDFADLRFAGVDGSGQLAVHDVGTDVLLVGTLDRFGGLDPAGDGEGGTALEVRRYDASMRSVWLDGSTELLVDADGTLSVDGTDLPGSYVSARI